MSDDEYLQSDSDNDEKPKTIKTKAPGYNDDDDEDEEEEEEEEDVNEVVALIEDEADDDEEDDDDDDDDENYLQKFDADVNKNYITDFHPECLIHNYDEIAKLSVVTRDDSNIIVDPLHKTVPFLTKYEKTRVLGQRSKQIECGAKPLVKVPENVIEGYIIAELELQQKRIPFIIKRPIPGGAFEYWNLKDLEIIGF